MNSSSGGSGRVHGYNKDENNSFLCMVYGIKFELNVLVFYFSVYNIITTHTLL